MQNKIGILLSNPFIRSIVSQPASNDRCPADHGFRPRAHHQSFQGRLGQEPAHLLGALLITAFAQAAEARQDIPEEERRDFTLYCASFRTLLRTVSRPSSRKHASGGFHWWLRTSTSANSRTAFGRPYRQCRHDHLVPSGRRRRRNPRRRTRREESRDARPDNSFKAWARVMHMASRATPN